MNSWSELNDKIDAAIALGPRFFAEKAYNAKQKVHRWSMICVCLRSSAAK
jgi:hypothetical protein